MLDTAAVGIVQIERCSEMLIGTEIGLAEIDMDMEIGMVGKDMGRASAVPRMGKAPAVSLW